MREKEGTGPQDSGGTPPIEELDNFELLPLDEFTDKVRDSISRTEATSNFVDLSTRGFFRLLLVYISTILGSIFSSADPHADSHEVEEKS